MPEWRTNIKGQREREREREREKETDKQKKEKTDGIREKHGTYRQFKLTVHFISKIPRVSSLASFERPFKFFAEN